MQDRKEILERVKWLRSQTVEFRKKYIANLQNTYGGFTQEMLEGIGIKWPPPRGWRKRFTDGKQKSLSQKRKEKLKAKKKPRPIRQKEKTVKKANFLQSYEWRRLRYDFLVDHDATCMACGQSPKDGAVMNVDHIKPRKTYPHLALDRDNLQILCGACNHGKGNRDETDWRP